MFIYRNEKIQAESVATRWKAQYYVGRGVWKRCFRGSGETTWTKLVALGPNPEPDAIVEIIGNNSWTRLDCSACGECVREVVELQPGDDPYFAICRECLAKAQEAFGN